MDNYAGQQFGDYRLLRLLATANLADTYLAEHLRLKSHHSVTIFRTHLFSGEQQALFLDETRRIILLNHPHIIQAIHSGIEQNIPFLVTRYVTGDNLRRRYPRGTRVPVAAVVGYVDRLAAALQYAHERQVTHRHVRPENIYLDENGTILLGGFGIEVVEDAPDAAEAVTYTPPEQIGGKSRPASDQYALAALAYEWLCGAPLFDASTPAEMVSIHLQEPIPDLSARVPGLPPAMSRVLSRALEKNFQQRFETIQQFAAALAAAYRGESGEREPIDESQLAGDHRDRPRELTRQQRVARRFVVGALAGVTALVAGGAGWYALTRQTTRRTTISIIEVGTAQVQGVPATETPAPPPTPPPTPTATSTLNVYRGFNNWVTSVAWSPDSRRLAASSRDQTVQVWDAATGQLVAARTDYPSPFDGNGVAWSPDGSMIASDCKDETVCFWNVANREQKLRVGGQGPLAWSPNGAYLAIANAIDQVILIYDTRSGALLNRYRQRPASQMPAGEVNRINALAWSPDNTYLASAGDDGGVEVFNPLTGSLISLYTGHLTNASSPSPGAGMLSTFIRRPVSPLRPRSATAYVIYSLAWSPDGKQIASACADRTVHISNALTGAARLIYNAHTGNVLAVAWSPSGNYLVSADNTNAAYVWDTTGHTLYTYQEHTNLISCIAWSPDGRWIASGSYDDTVRIWHPV